MKIQRFEVSNTPHLTITCHSDLDIKGGREGEIAIKAYGSEENLAIEREGQSLTITTHVRCKIGCPQGTTITIPETLGSLKIQHVDGPIAVEQIHGDVVLKEVGPTTITSISGSVRARAIQGDLRLDQVSGDLQVRDVEGFLSNENVSGSLRAFHLEGGLKAEVGGDGILTTDFTPGCNYELVTAGNAVIKFPEQASARVEVIAGGTINTKVEWSEISQEANMLSAQLGDGEANVTINAGGDVSLRSKSGFKGFGFRMTMGDDFDFSIEDDFNIGLESMAEEIERNIEAHMTQLEAQLSRIDHEAISRRAERAAERAAEKIRHKAQLAAERTQLKAEKAQRRWQRMGGAPRPPRPPRPPAVPSQPRHRTGAPTTEEERMLILNMLQEGKISVEEAAQLLQALEG